MPNFENGPGTENQTPLESLGATVSAPVRALMDWGALHLEAEASYQVLYADGVQSQPGHQSKTITHTFSPSIAAFLGPYWTFSYSPSYRIFSDKNFRNTLDQSLGLSGGTSYHNWSFGLSQGYSISDEPTIQTGGQTKQQSYSAGANASYRFNSKWSESTSFSTGINFVGGNNVNTNTPGGQPLTDTQSFSVAENVNYQFCAPLSGGVAVSVGTSDQATGFSSISEQYTANISWIPGPKLTFALNAGIQTQQYLDSNSHSSDLNPVYGVTLTYHVFEPTTLTLSANQSISASLFQNQNNISTQLSLAVQQRLLQRLYLSVNFGYNTADYIEGTGGGGTVRTDNSYSVNVGLSFSFLKRATASVSYAYSHNNSSLSDFQYSSSQIGATLGWKF